MSQAQLVPQTELMTAVSGRVMPRRSYAGHLFVDWSD